MSNYVGQTGNNEKVDSTPVGDKESSGKRVVLYYFETSSYILF